LSKGGFQGPERDDEIAGKGNSLHTFFRQNSPQSGRWLSIDPKAAMQPSISPYVLYGNNPIMFTDPLGDIYTPPDPNRQNVEGSPVYKIKENTNHKTGDIWNSWEKTGSVWSNGQAMNQSDWENKVRTYVESLEHADFSHGMPEGDFSGGYENSPDFQATYSKYFNATYEIIPWSGQPNPNMDTYNPGDDPMYDLLAIYIGEKTFQMIGKGFWVLRGAGGAEASAALNSFDNITYPTIQGKYPSWTTVRNRYWKLRNNGKTPRRTAIVKMNDGRIIEKTVSKELHHIRGRNIPDPHNINNLQEVWPWEHAGIDPHRYINYQFIKWTE
jgi:RHS repeat-associated protein